MHYTVNALYSFVKGIFLLNIGHNHERELASVVVVKVDEIFSLVKLNANTSCSRESRRRYAYGAVRDSRSSVVKECLLASVSCRSAILHTFDWDRTNVEQVVIDTD